MAEKKLILGTLAALRPARWLMRHVDETIRRLQGHPFNFLHLRVEKDWQAHCDRWAALSASDGAVRDNCFNNTVGVHAVMESMGLEKDLPVFVSAHWPSADPALCDTITTAIRGAGYTIVTAEGGAGRQGGGLKGRDGAAAGATSDLPDDLLHAVDYEVAMRAARFLGNSVSTFSALAILQRRHGGMWAGYYNGGDIPLAKVLPLFPLPWVFTFNSWSRGYEPMLKAAVNSAAKQGGITPHCVFAGDPSAPIASWMQGRSVRVIPHEPAWRRALVSLTRGHSDANMRHSHLFASDESVVGTWQRIDLPVVPWLDQYTYVLYTDADVMFRRPVGLHDFPKPLPKAVGMGPEMVDSFPYNAGVMLVNVPALRATYPRFLDFVLSNRDGLTFPGYGPGDQGAYNQFYEREVLQWRLPLKFNAKPYHASAPALVSDVAIVHFHGPKPSDYLQYATTGACPRFGGLCRAGLQARACRFVQEWVGRLEREDAAEARELWRTGCGGRAAQQAVAAVR